MESRSAVLIFQKRMGPGAWKHRGALHLRYRRRGSGRHQYDLRIRKRVAFALQSRGYVRIVERCNEASSCLWPRPHPDLAMSKVTSLIRWRHAPPQELADGLSSARCVPPWSYDRGRQCPRSREPNAPWLHQVQRANAAADTGRCQAMPMAV